jgi:hypothetical protein
MSHIVRDDGDHNGSLAGVVVACSVHEPALLRAVTSADAVDDTTLREVDAAMECPACRLLLALASANPAVVGMRSDEWKAQNVIPFERSSSRGMVAQSKGALSRRVVVLQGQVAASGGFGLLVGRATPGRFQMELGLAQPTQHTARVEVRVGARTSIGVRWLSGASVRRKGDAAPLGRSSITVPAQPGRPVTEVVEHALEWID